MTKVPFGTLSAALAVLGTALVFLAFQLRAEGYEQYVGPVANASAALYFTALMTVVTWVRDRQTHSD